MANASDKTHAKGDGSSASEPFGAADKIRRIVTPQDAATPYDALTRTQLIALLKKRDAEKRLGLVWERNDIDSDRAIDSNFVVADLIEDQCEKQKPWDNLIIEGDNYDALRWLRMAFRGKVKAIYIDPPYNTGNKDWVYNDDYVDPNHRFRQSQWLEFLYQRLLIARDLMAPDGVLFCSINDKSRATLELMMEQALPGMRIGSFVWRTRAGTKGEGPYFSQDNEYVLVFGNKNFRFGGTAPDLTKYTNEDNDTRGAWTSVALQTNKDRTERKNSYFPVQNPATGHWHPCNPNRVWPFLLRNMKGARGPTYEDMLESKLIIFSKEGQSQRFESKTALLKAIAEGEAHDYLKADLPDLEFWVGKDIGLGTVRKKQFLSDLKQATKPVSSWIGSSAQPNDDPEIVALQSGMTAEGSKQIIDLFDKKVFNYAKPVSLIRELLRQSTGPSDLVLDFFAGSGTTAHAVMELNAQDNGDRRFILVSSTEATADEPHKNLCQSVTAERVRRLNADTEKYENLSAGFAYLKCREINPLEIDDQLTPEAAWTIIQTHHRLSLTPWPTGKRMAVHLDGDTAVVLVDRWDKQVQKSLNTYINRARTTFIYAFAPGQVTDLNPSASLEVLDVLQTVRRLFAS